MADLFENVTSILKAEQILEGYFNPTQEKNNILSSVPLTIDDCSFLISEICRLVNSKAPATFLEEMPLCFLTAWAFSIKYQSVNPSLRESILAASKNIEQHHYRFYVAILSNTIYEYAIETFGYNHTNFEGLSNIMRKHAMAIE